MNAMKQEDEFLKQLFQDSADRPNGDITEKVMHRIGENSKVFEYEPVISKRGWIILGSLFFGTLLMLLLSMNSSGFRMPGLVQLINDSFSGLGRQFKFEVNVPSLPDLPTPLLISFAAINVMGIYLMVSFKWLKGMFRS